MKKLLAMLLAVCVMFAFAACGQENDVEANLPASALEILTTVWDKMPEKFPAMGGGYENITDGAPGALTATDTGYLTGNLIVPEAEAANVSEAASITHAMMANNFTAGAFKVTDAAAFAAALETAVMGNQWICGFPETLVIATFGNTYVVMGYGAGDILTAFHTALTAAYPDAAVVCNDPIM